MDDSELAQRRLWHVHLALELAAKLPPKRKAAGEGLLLHLRRSHHGGLLPTWQTGLLVLLVRLLLLMHRIRLLLRRILLLALVLLLVWLRLLALVRVLVLHWVWLLCLALVWRQLLALILLRRRHPPWSGRCIAIVCRLLRRRRLPGMTQMHSLSQLRSEHLQARRMM